MALPLTYQQVRQLLEAIKPESIAREHKIITAEIERLIAEIPNTFHELEAFPRSLGVEIHKQLHLLKNDLYFWQAARQEATQAQRWQQIQHRLATLEAYMQQLLTLGKNIGE